MSDELWGGRWLMRSDGRAAARPHRGRTGARGWWGRPAGRPSGRVQFSTPANIMHTALIWPVIYLFDQSGSKRIFAHVLPFFRVALAASQPMMKPDGLKSTRLGSCFGEAILPKGNPAFDREFQIARRTKDGDDRASINNRSPTTPWPCVPIFRAKRVEWMVAPANL